jgi:alginate O-acetyltransferase complex protein AlgI
MLFNSRGFLFLFLPIAYFVFWKLGTKQSRYVWLTITGYVFYSFWNYRFCSLMAFSTLVSYFAGRGLLRFQDTTRRKLCLIVPIVVDLSLLAFFKYLNFAADSAAWIAAFLGLGSVASFITSAHIQASAVSGHFLQGALLPVGISFYTFHTITYIVDGYRGTIKPTKNFFEFASYVSLFPQLIAGPITRFRQVEGDLEHLDTASRSGGLDIGWSYFAIGMMKKVVIADTIAAVINPAFTHFADVSTVGAWLCALGYTYQLYFDFSGYSDMAVGLGHMFGIRLPQNFNSPYKATDPSDFWRRWHISLSTCLRDYLYIPMGGNRSHLYRNLILTMLLGGLWHGANWTFVIWGAYHGALLMLYRAYGWAWDAVPAAIRRLGMFLLVVIGWVIFRADTFDMATVILRKMFVPTDGDLFIGATTLVAVIALAAITAHAAPNTFEVRHQWSPQMSAAMTAGFACCLILIMGGQRSPFLYFQF